MTSPIPADIHYDDGRSVLLIGPSPDAEAAAAHAGLRSVGSVDLLDAPTRLAQSAKLDSILVETAGVDPSLADPALSAIGTIARERDIDVVVAMREDQVDWVAARLLGRHAQLLCDPSVAERVAALRWAAATRDGRVHDSARDADERLRRLNDEVARFAATLSRLATERDAPRMEQVRDAAIGFRAGPAEPAYLPEPAGVRDVIRARRMRASYFAENLFADPAWDMLLDLFAAELEHRRVSVSSLCIAAAVPGTTALRWIGSMVEAGLFERYDDPQDRRRAFISLSASARDGMTGYFGAVRRAGLAPA